MQFSVLMVQESSTKGQEWCDFSVPSLPGVEMALGMDPERWWAL